MGLNLLNDLIPKIIGMKAAWRWANNKIEKNKINSNTQFILNSNIVISLKLSQERNIPLSNHHY